MLPIIIAVSIVVLLVVGFQNRKKEKKAWLREERYEDSGEWLDKRAGERGTYGRVDREMETDRKQAFREGQILELAKQLANWSGLAETKNWVFLKEKALEIMDLAEKTMASKSTPTPLSDISGESATALKKQILAWLYANTSLLERAEIEQIRDLDAAVERVAASVVRHVT
jgi:uncharacterized lipoprotein NlpE involved in copper resistance